MSIKRTIFEFLTLPFRLVMRHANAATARLALACRPVYVATQEPGTVLRFHCPTPVTLWRARTLFTKEPDTIGWIKSFEHGAVLFDVGANIGVYSLYAASRGTQVYAFEPESQNYALLNQNIELNQLQSRMLAYNFALNRRPGLDVLQVSSTETGSALHAVGEAKNNYSTTTNAFRQGVACYSLDQLIYALGLPVPGYLKIDVDGIEPDIIAGASRLLADPTMLGLLIELDEADPSHQALVPAIENFGLTLVSKQASPLSAGTRFEAVCNHIFSRIPSNTLVAPPGNLSQP